MREREIVSDILQGVSHQLRIKIIETLETQPKTFSGIMVSCGLDPNFDSGLFYYHLSELIERGIVEKDGDVYRLTDFGLVVLKVLKTVRTEYSSFTKRKGGKAYKEVKRLEKKVEIVPVERPDLAIEKEDCRLELGRVYWGVTLKTMGVDKVTAVWPLSDGSVMYEVRDPGYEHEGYGILHLTDKGLYVIETVFQMERGGEKTTIWFGDRETPILPLPLSVGRRIEYESQSLQLSTNAKATGWKSIEGERRVKGEVIGQFKVYIDNKVFNCLLLREVIETAGVVTREDGSRERYDPMIRVMMDRYLNENGRLRLEHLWYCENGGRRSMTREEAKKRAGPIFRETTYAGTRWFRVNQVELDEPRPEEAKAYIEREKI